jgi:aminoglycoside N3'-acetyltransferase
VKITKNQIASDLKSLGLKEGSHVAVSLSLKSIGFVEGGPDAFIDAVLDVIGPEGTLMMNTYTRLFPLSDIDPQYVFDPETTIPWTGIVPSTLMKRKNAIRSRHPACSVVALGKHARFLTEGHDEHVENEYLPYVKLAQTNGHYLCIGINDNFVAIRHEAQRRAGLFVVPKFTGVMYKNRQGETKPFILRNAICSVTQPLLVPQLVEMGIVKRGKIGMASSTLSPASELIEAMTSLLSEDPTLNLCSNAFCLECRELERRLNLYDRIRNPGFFQRNIAARKLIELRNKIVLRRYACVRVSNSKQNGKPNLSLFAERGIPNLVGSISRILGKSGTNGGKEQTNSSNELSQDAIGSRT